MSKSLMLGRSFRSIGLSRTLRLPSDSLLETHRTRCILPSQGSTRPSQTGSEGRQRSPALPGSRKESSRPGSVAGQRSSPHQQGKTTLKIPTESPWPHDSSFGVPRTVVATVIKCSLRS